MRGFSIYVLTCLIVVPVFVAKAQATVLPDVNNKGLQDRHTGTHGSGQRIKRASEIVIGKAALKGLLSLKSLLKGAKQIPTGEKLRLYKKKGSYDTAVEEFLSLEPRGAHKFNMPDGASGIAGRVGDRLLVLKKTGYTGYPTMDIVKIQDVSKVGHEGHVRGKLTDQIIYSE